MKKNSMMKKYSLHFKKTVAYVEKHLSEGFKCSQRALETINLHEGAFYTFFHQPVDESRLYLFDSGGIVPFAGSSVIDKLLATFIHNALTVNASNAFLYENVAMSENDPILAKVPAEIHTFQGAVVHIFREAMPALLYEFLRQVESLWHLFGIFSEIQSLTTFPKQLTPKIIDEFCDHVKLIVVRAYDLEGYVLWIKDTKLVETLDETLNLHESQHRQ